MAIYKVGDRYLSEEEYAAEVDANWSIVLFILGFFLGCAIVAMTLFLLYFSGVQIQDWQKWIRFSLVIVAVAIGIIVGIILVRLRSFIRKWLPIVIILTILGLLGTAIWEAL